MPKTGLAQSPGGREMLRGMMVGIWLEQAGWRDESRPARAGEWEKMREPVESGSARFPPPSPLSH